MSIDELKQQLAGLETQRIVLSEQIADIKGQIALLSTPLRVGDRITYRRKTWVLTRISAGYSDGSRPKFYGSLVKKDGSMSAFERDLWLAYGEELRKVEA